MNAKPKKRWIKPSVQSLAIQANECTGGGMPRSVRCSQQGVPQGQVPCSQKNKNTAFS